MDHTRNVTPTRAKIANLFKDEDPQKPYPFGRHTPI